MPKIYKRNCNQCGEYYENQGDNFCSRQCYFLSRKPNDRECKKCGEMYIGYINGGLYFCSNKCKGESMLGIRFSQEHKINISKNHADISGKNNPNWMGGIGNEPYPFEFDEELKDYIRERDEYICIYCGQTQEQELGQRNRKLAIHHIDYNKQNCDEYNLVTTCTSCNSRANFNKNYWIEFFTKKILNLNYEKT